MDVCQSYFIASRTFYHYNLNHIQWELTQNKVHILCQQESIFFKVVLTKFYISTDQNTVNSALNASTLVF